MIWRTFRAAHEISTFTLQQGVYLMHVYTWVVLFELCSRFNWRKRGKLYAEVAYIRRSGGLSKRFGHFHALRKIQTEAGGEWFGSWPRFRIFCSLFLRLLFRFATLFHVRRFIRVATSSNTVIGFGWSPICSRELSITLYFAKFNAPVDPT